MPTEKKQSKIIDADFTDKHEDDEESDQQDDTTMPDVAESRAVGEPIQYTGRLKAVLITLATLAFAVLAILYVYGSQLA
jgi:hypothetical protein